MPECQGQILALTVLYVPHSLDIGPTIGVVPGTNHARSRPLPATNPPDISQLFREKEEKEDTDSEFLAAEVSSQAHEGPDVVRFNTRFISIFPSFFSQIELDLSFLLPRRPSSAFLLPLIFVY